MLAQVQFTVSDGRVVTLGPGDIIGRGSHVTLRVADPGASEAHAMLSLRGGDMMLLALRGRFQLDGERLSKLILRRGQVIALSPQTTLTVGTVQLPAAVLGLEIAGLGRQILSGVTSLVEGDALQPARLVPRFEPAAVAWFYSVDGAWRLHHDGANTVPLLPGQLLDIAGLQVRVVSVELESAGHAPTSVEDALDVPLRIVARYDSVQIYRTQDVVVSLSGIGARVISELVAIDRPTPWETLAREVWSDANSDVADLRARFDAAMSRLRRTLRQAGLRGDLIVNDGHGNVELIRHAHDQLVDET